MNRLRFLWKRQPVVLSAFLVASAVALFFLGRMVVFTIYWAGHRNVPIAGWMTPLYIERSWDLPKFTLRDPLGLKPLEKGQRPQTVAEMARARGITEAEMIALVQSLVDDARAGARRP